MKLISGEQRDRFFTTFTHEALHLEMRDVYAVTDEAQRLRRFLEKGYRDHDAEAQQRRPWLTLIQNGTAAGKVFRRARIVSEPVTDYIRYEWAGTTANVQAGEDIKWLPRRLASGIAVPGNDFWLFDDSTVIFTIFTGRALASCCGWHFTKISKLEHGTQNPSENDPRAWCHACNAADQLPDRLSSARISWVGTCCEHG